MERRRRELPPRERGAGRVSYQPGKSLSPIRDKWEEPDRTLKINIARKSVCSLPTCFSADTLAPNSSRGLFPHFLSNYVVWVFSLLSPPPPPGIDTTSRSALIKARSQQWEAAMSSQSHETKHELLESHGQPALTSGHLAAPRHLKTPPRMLFLIPGWFRVMCQDRAPDS